MEEGKYSYYIKDIETGEEYELKETKKESEYTFTGLEQNKEYRIKVKAKNENGEIEKESSIIRTIELEDLEEAEITFEYSPEGWTNKEITVTAKTEQTLQEGSYIETSKDGTNWDKQEQQKFDANGTMYVRIYDGRNESNYAVAEVTKIDKDAPTITITVDNTPDYINPRVKARVELKDSKSDINLSKSKWIITSSNTPVGENPASYTGTFTSKSQNIESDKKPNGGTYYIHVLATDNAGNPKEEIQKAEVATDKIQPTVTIQVDQKTNYINGKIKATVKIADKETGINYSKSKWVINSSETPLGNTLSSYSGGTLTKAEQEIESDKKTAVGTYYIHILATDNAGNLKEEIASAEIKNGYAISNPTEFQNMKNDKAGHYYVINDIDMSGFNFTTIKGDFRGSLDGQGFTISNLKLRPNSDASPKTGIFDALNGTVYIKNILFKNVDLRDPSGKADMYVVAKTLGTYTSGGIQAIDVTIENVGITGTMGCGKDQFGSSGSLRCFHLLALCYFGRCVQMPLKVY